MLAHISFSIIWKFRNESSNDYRIEHWSGHQRKKRWSAFLCPRSSAPQRYNLKFKIKDTISDVQNGFESQICMKIFGNFIKNRLAPAPYIFLKLSGKAGEIAGSTRSTLFGSDKFEWKLFKNIKMSNQSATFLCFPCFLFKFVTSKTGGRNPMAPLANGSMPPVTLRSMLRVTKVDNSKIQT